MTKISLYQATVDLVELFNEMDPETGELPEGFDAARDIVAAKQTDTAAAILNMAERAKAIKARAAELKAAAEVIERRIDYLKIYLSENMKAAGMDKITGPDFSAKLYIARDASVIIDNLEDLPPEYIRTKTTHEAEKRAILEAIKSGQTVAGAHVEYKDRLTLK